LGSVDHVLHPTILRAATGDDLADTVAVAPGAVGAGWTSADIVPIPPDTKEAQTRMGELKGSQTESNLKEAFAGESQANRRYLYFAQKADVEGHPDVAALFRSVAEGETGHAFGHFDFLAEVGDPATGEPVGSTANNLKSAIAGETYEYTEMYPGFAKTARDEGLEEVAEWLETLARAEKSHSGRFAQALESIS
jgi:rubrerythrin